MIKKESSQMDNITVLRVAACLGVFVVHLGQRMGLSGVIRTITDFGLYGVYLFFIISGFLGMTNKGSGGGGQTVTYWYKRAVRILPLYYIVILYYFLSETFFWKYIPTDATGLGWTRYLFFLHGFVKSDTYFWSNLGITWTIPIFVLFYLMIPFVCKVVKNYNRAVVLYMLLVCVDYIVRKYCGGNLLAVTYMFYFAEGIILYFARKEQKENLTILGVSILLIIQLIRGHIDSTTYAFIFMLIFIVTQNMTIYCDKVKKLVYTLDKYSYTIYLGHGLIFCGFLDKFSFKPMQVLGIAVCGTALLVVVIYNFIEQPIQKFLRKYIE